MDTGLSLYLSLLCTGPHAGEHATMNIDVRHAIVVPFTLRVEDSCIGKVDGDTSTTPPVMCVVVPVAIWVLQQRVQHLLV